VRHPEIDQLRDEIYSVAARQPRKDQPSTAGTWDHEEALRQQIPPRDMADVLVQTYMGRFEIIHRVLHIPEFMTKYDHHWVQPQLTPALYLTQLLLVMAAAASFHLEEPVGGMSAPSIRPLTVRWIETAEAWLVSWSSEPPESWSSLMTQCLLVIAKRANCVQDSALWTATGTLVKWAMAAGYHRESGPTVRLSPFHREMRRRLWATILELDIQASVERGMPPTIRKGEFSTHPILHVDDTAIQESTSMAPVPQSLTTWTDTSFQAILQRSVTVRLEVCALVNGSRDEVEFDEILRLGDELAQAIRDIPVWNDDPHTSLQHQQATSYANTMLSLILHQNILILHIPWAIQTPPTFRSGLARHARLEAASVIISHYKRLVHDNIIPESACRNGLVLAAISICHDLYLSCAGPGKLGHRTISVTSIDQNADISEIEPRQSMSTIPELAEIFLSMTERALEMIGKRVITQFQGLNEYYVVCMSIGLVKSRLWPESQFTSAEEAAERHIRASTLVRSSATALDSPRFDTAVPTNNNINRVTNYATQKLSCWARFSRTSVFPICW
jgi:hypothetical protein